MHFAELTFKLFPNQSVGIIGGLVGHLGCQPCFKTIVVNVLYRSDAVAGSDLWILLRIVVDPAKPAHLLLVCLGDVLYMFGLFKFFLISVFLNVEVLVG